MSLIIIVITALISIIAFSNHSFFEKWQLNPSNTYHRKQYYRLLTHGFLHAGWLHLIVNMFVLYSFGFAVESYFRAYNGVVNHPTLWFTFMYLSAIIISSLPTMKRYRDASWYNAVGASGAVSAVVFTSIFFEPWQKLYFFAIIPIPGIIFGPLYLWYSHYMGTKEGYDNINHEAHFIGALYGFVFPIMLEPKLIYVFINKLISF
jgi:membrane associated rhomboid family serine protease